MFGMRGIKRLINLVSNTMTDLFNQTFIQGIELDFTLGFAHCLRHFYLGGNDWLNRLVPELQCGDHGLFINLI